MSLLGWKTLWRRGTHTIGVRAVPRGVSPRSTMGAPPGDTSTSGGATPPSQASVSTPKTYSESCDHTADHHYQHQRKTREKIETCAKKTPHEQKWAWGGIHLQDATPPLLLQLRKTILIESLALHPQSDAHWRDAVPVRPVRKGFQRQKQPDETLADPPQQDHDPQSDVHGHRANSIIGSTTLKFFKIVFAIFI